MSALVISPDRDALPGSEPASSPGRLSLLASSLDRMMLLMDCDIMVLINPQYMFLMSATLTVFGPSEYLWHHRFGRLPKFSLYLLPIERRDMSLIDDK